jgi:hypothetical protein
MGGHGRGAEARDFPFHTPDIGDQAARGERWGNLLDERNDFIDRGRDHDDARLADGIFGRIRDTIAPRLLAQRKAGRGAPCPDNDALGRAVPAGGACDRGAK